jgi:hypothetical protein
MLRKFKVYYKAVRKKGIVEIDAFSKYDAKQRFKRTYPKYEIIKGEEVEDEQR